MKKIGILIFITALAIGIAVSSIFSFGKITRKLFNISIGWSGECGSGNVVTEKREVSGFKGVDASGAIQVEIVAGKEYSVEVEADDNLVPLVRTEVEGGVLKIETEKRISSKTALRVRISAPDIESIEASGASGITLSGVKNSDLNVHLSGASKANVEGTTGTLTVDVSGASVVDADLSGASKVRYAGDPKNIIRNTSGASRVEQMTGGK